MKTNVTAPQWYRLLQSDNDDAGKPFIVCDSCYHECDKTILESGIEILNWNSKSWVKSTSSDCDGNPADIIFDYTTIPIVSSKIMNAIIVNKVNIDDLQFLPINVIQSTGNELHGYHVINIKNRLAGLDRDRSFMLSESDEEIDPNTGRPLITGVFRIALVSNVVHGHDIARLIEFNSAVLVSQHFADILHALHCTGMKLSAVEMV